MQTEDWPVAEEAFSRCTTLDDEDGDSWSNLASVHLRRTDAVTEDSQALNSTSDDYSNSSELDKIPFGRKRAAYECLRQAVRHSYENWRVWQNYMIVAVAVGEMSEACRAMDRVIEMRFSKEGEKAIDLDVLDRLVGAVTFTVPSNSSNGQNQFLNPNEGRGLSPRVSRLFTEVILSRLSSSARIFSAHAKLLLWSGDYRNALDAHLKAYRCSIAQG